MLEFDLSLFSEVEDAVFVGGDLTSQSLMDAYAQGFFPWPSEEGRLFWCSPAQRGVLFFSRLKVSRTLRRRRQTVGWSFSVNRCFPQVMERCSLRKDGKTWITPELCQSYQNLAEEGFAHSFECWRGGHLVGGTYGVFAKGVFSAESMFFSEANEGHLALFYMVDQLVLSGLTFLDIQMVTPTTEAIGGTYIPRAEFLKSLDPL